MFVFQNIPGVDHHVITPPWKKTVKISDEKVKNIKFRHMMNVNLKHIFDTTKKYYTLVI